ncbi:protein lifeguard 1 [Cottoperca gobio]|uniref:Protein lifeguard 1 n=1 Tax=Cottoperca gobio TaxID=56716 RepID=A0A6J2RG28_COTGO|nr:protein lifeguard 1-like [Cottoperca gobio]
MSDTAETQDAPADDVSSSPTSYEAQQPPPYSAAPEMYPATKTETACTYQPTTGYESFWDISPVASSDTTPLIAPSSFDDKTVRRAFVRKMLSILTLQLLFTFSVVCVFTFSGGKVEQINLLAYFSSFIIFLVLTSALTFSKSFSRRHPWNTVALVVVILSLSYMVGTIACFHDTTDVAITLGATLVISLAIIGFSEQTDDFNIWFGVLLILTVDVIVFVFLQLLREGVTVRR